MAIPEFRDDGFLPLGVHKATEAEVFQRFGSNARRVDLLVEVNRWVRLARAIGAYRFVLDGSFVTSKPEPKDVDCVCWLPRDFEQQYEWGRREAVELYGIIAQNWPKELFGVLDEEEWNRYLNLFSMIRDEDTLQKGIVEIVL